MTLRTIIVDDEQKGIDTLNILIGKFIPEIKVVDQTRNPLAAVEMIENYKPEIIFLDINMPELNGFELLEKLRWKNFNLVFTTAHQEFALRALKNNAIDYLLKPIDHADLRLAIDKIIKKLGDEAVINRFNYADLINSIGPGSRQKVIINSRSGVESLDVHEIICLESRSNYTVVSLSGNREILSSKPLKEYDIQLCTEGSAFMRIHNSFIINLNKVTRYLKASEEVVMNNDQKLPVAKSRREAFFSWLSV